MQLDTEAAIRTNTCILIGRLGPSLGYNTKRKVLVPAFARALKDTFVHARVAGLMAFMATVDCFDAEELATTVPLRSEYGRHHRRPRGRMGMESESSQSHSL